MKRWCMIFTLAVAGIGTAAQEIDWSSSKPVLVQGDGHYGRITRLDRSTLLACFDWNRAIHVRHSTDEGKTWKEAVRVAGWEHGGLTNTELLVLKNGEVLCFFNRRPARGRMEHPFSIGMCRSKNGGKDWSEATTVYEAGKEFENGCWEPVGLQMPDGEVHVYFANEGPYRESTEQEITLMRSKDNGKTWDKPEAISFRKGSRDGMPVPVLSSKGKALAMAIEDNGLSGTFKPVIVSSRATKGGWREGVAEGDSSRRWSALAKPLAPAVYAGAPYLRQFPDGPFVLSYQLAESGEMNQSRMAVSVGNNTARNFGEPSFPFPADGRRPQLWNSLFIKDSTTVTAVSETSQNGVRGIWAIDGKLK